MIEVAPGKTVEAVITPEFVYKINGDTQHVQRVRTMLWRTPHKPFMTWSCRSVFDNKGLARHSSFTLAIHVTPSLQPFRGRGGFLDLLPSQKKSVRCFVEKNVKICRVSWMYDVISNILVAASTSRPSQ